MLEYIHGASQEIYVIKIPSEFTIPTKFSLFVQHAYLEYGVLIIGLKTRKDYEYDKDIHYNNRLHYSGFGKNCRQ